MKNKRGGRKGFSLVELLIAIVVLAILGTITFVAGSAAQERARVTSAMTVFDDYKAAFNTALMDHPGIVTDRREAGKDATAPVPPLWKDIYTTKKGLTRLVNEMNKGLDGNLTLVWHPLDATEPDGPGWFESAGEDPWGGHYVLMESPVTPGDSEDLAYWDASTAKTGEASMRVSIWCSGPDAGIIHVESGVVTVTNRSIGVRFCADAGSYTYDTHGSQDGGTPFAGDTIYIK